MGREQCTDFFSFHRLPSGQCHSSDEYNWKPGKGVQKSRVSATMGQLSGHRAGSGGSMETVQNTPRAVWKDVLLETHGRMVMRESQAFPHFLNLFFYNEHMLFQ